MQEMINFGIDLGTTNSAIAKFNKGIVEVFRNPSGFKDTLPSVVAFRKDRILVGDKAREYLERDPQNVVGIFKRKMGTTESFKIKVTQDTKTPIELSSHVLKELKNFVQTGEKVESAVITIPASFDIIQSNATSEAAYAAGLKQVVLLQEPIAASLAYANKVKLEQAQEGRWLVYDLGGGTFDVALVKIQNGEMKILDHEGDNYLGGTDFDRLIIERFIVPHLNENSFEINLERDLQSASGKYNSLFYKLLHIAETAKIELSTKSSAEIEFDFNGEEIFITITKSEFQEIIKELVDKTAQMVKAIFARNSLTSKDISFVLMVGGSTYIPYVRKRIEELLDVPVKTDIDPITAIATGAAYYAGTKERQHDENKKTENYKISVKAVYEKASREEDELFVAKITGNTEGLFYSIRRMDKGFNTGLKKLTERISEDLPLVKDSFNFFTFSIFDGQNNEIETNFKEIQIAQNTWSFEGGQPLAHDVCLELDDPDNGNTKLNLIFSRNSPLPLKSSTYTQTITKNIVKGSSDKLSVNIYQGSVQSIPEANKLFGTVTISGEQIKRDLIKGAEIELKFYMSSNTELKVSAYIPFTDQTFEEVFISKLREVAIERLNEDIENLDERLQQELTVAIERNDNDLKKTLSSFADEITDLQDKTIWLNEDDTTDIKFQLDDQKRELARKIHSAIKEKQSIILQEKYQAMKFKCQQLIDEEDEEKHRNHLAEIIALENSYLNPPSILKLQGKISEIEGLYWSIRWKQPKFLTNLFNSIVDDENIYSKQYEAEKLIEEGQLAIISSEYNNLREVIFKLLDLLPNKAKYDGRVGIG